MKILVPTDFSVPSKAAIKYALMIADNIECEIILFHAIEAPSHSSTLMRDIDDKITQGAKLDFENFYEVLKEEIGFSLNLKREMHIGKPAEAIVSYCSDNDIDVIIMGNTGEGALHKLFMGSNALKVIEESNIPVITVPDKTQIKKIKEIVYATDMGDTRDELEKLVNFARFLNAKINVIHIYKKEAESNKYDNAIVEAELKRRNNYENIRFHTEINSDIEDGIAHYVIAKRADILAMFARKRSFFQRLFEKSFTHDVADENNLPLFIYKKDGSDDDLGYIYK